MICISKNTNMEEYSSVSGERTGKILRRSIFSFLQNYQYFTTTAAFLGFPFSVSALLAQSFAPSSSLLQLIQSRLRSLFDAAGFPGSSEFVTILNLKLSQTISTSLLVLPFTLSFLLFAKASIVQAINNPKRPSEPGFRKIISIYRPLLITQLCNFLIVLSANATCFSILFFAFNFVDALGLSNPKTILLISAAGAVLYSIILANALIICNLALVLSGMEKTGGYIAILKACVLIRGRTATALSLVLPVTMALASVEALFQYRIVSAYYYRSESSFSSMALEALFIAYLYSILFVMDTIVACLFFKSCKSTCRIDPEEKYFSGIQIEEKDGDALARLKLLELP